MLNPARLQQLRSLLERRERVLRSEMRKALHERLGRDIEALETGAGGEQSVAELLEGVDTSMLTRDVDELTAIEAARGHFKDGSYGTCSACQGAISFTRLLALPTATRCLTCQEAFERSHRAGKENSL